MRQRFPTLGPSAVGDDFHDVCTDQGCEVCALWPRAGESHEAFLARVGALFNAEPRWPWQKRDELEAAS